MIKEIKYNGITTVPPDNTSPDGDTALLLNLLPEDGALKPVLPPKTVMKLQQNMHIVYIHKTSAFTHYIIHDIQNKKLAWTTDDNNITDLYTLQNKELYQVVAIGNTLVALTNNGMLYFLWKGSQTGYLFLGNSIPELPLSFGLQGEMERTDEFTINFNSISYEDKVAPNGETYHSWHEFSDENKQKITSQVLAKVNKFIADKSTNKGKFIYPFLVRYAYRLYDGSLIMHSAPVLMVCSTSCAPIAIWRNIFGDKRYDSANIRIIGMLHKLDYAVIDDSNSKIGQLKNWADIVKSVDIFVSKPIYTYDQSGECDKFYNYNEYGQDTWGYSICKHTNQAADSTLYPVRYQKKDIGYLYQMTFDKENLGMRPGGILGLPRKDTATVKEDIRNCANFYFLESIKIDQLTTTRTIINVEEDYLQSLINREVMTDDYDSHDKLSPQYAFGYNARLNLANIKKTLFQGFNAGAMLPYTDGRVDINIDYDQDTKTIKATYPNTSLNTTRPIYVYIFIKQDGKDIVVQGSASHLGTTSPTLFIYYPNVNAYRAIITVSDYFPNYFDVPLEPHAFLNGSFFFGGWGEITTRAAEPPTISNDTERTIDIHNKIYTSEVNNPFFFPVKGINTVGTGSIIGISSAVKALSEGQFGQFPLYAFTTEGVWALEVSNMGVYTARQPITRDVCLNPKSITQIDSAVLFATKRGIILLQGSQATCISDNLNGDNTVSITALPKIENILAHTGLGKNTLQTLPFMDFLKDCRMIYDYYHQRIIAYNDGKDPATNTLICNYAYVWSLKSKQWGMMQSNITNNVNSYPDALAVVVDGTLVNFSDEADKTYKNILISRPIKLDAYDIHKSVDTIIQRGVFQRGHVQTVLYASNDLYNWVPVWSSVDHYLRGFRGTPYKYIRIALLTRLSKHEGITGCSVQFRPRLNNQPR